MPTPYDLYQVATSNNLMSPAQMRQTASSKKEYLEKPQFVHLGGGPGEQELDSQTRYVNQGGSMASDAFQVNDRSAGSQQFMVNDRTGGSDQF